MKMPENGYFRLRPECYLVLGALKGAIYNLLSGEIFALEAYERKIIEACEANEPVEKISQVSGASEKKVSDFLLQLEENHVGMFFEKPVFIDKYIDRTLLDVKQFWRDPPQLEIASVELSNQCNLDCYFCRGQQVVRRWACMGCSRQPVMGSESITEKDYLDILEQLNKLKCQNLNVRGGNPLCEADKFRAVVKKARSLDFNQIFVVTNGVDISPEMVRFLKEHSVHPIIQVFSHKAELFDSICGKTGSFARLTTQLKQFNKLNIPFSLTALFPHADMEEMKGTRAYFQSFSPVNMIRDHFLPLPPDNTFGSKADAVQKELYYQNKDLPRTSVKDFFDKKQYNPCLNGKLAITLTGDVLPCPEMRNDIIGNIKTKTIQELFTAEAFDTYWGLKKEKIVTCKQCEYRYACSDCRALEQSGTGDLHGLKYCAYEPEQGKWEEIKRGDSSEPVF
jgi:radical SAM protein with 4Fe4S-binding SPASM domain